MKIFTIKSNLTVLQKICLAGLFIALVTIFQKLLAVNYLPGLPFVRISFGGPALIIFSSILLGPLYGALVGAASDVLGYFIFDMSSYAYFPHVTIVYALLGLSAYFVFALIRNLKSKKLMFIIEFATFAAFVAFVSIYFFTQVNKELWIKILAVSSISALFIGLIIFILLYNKKVKQNYGFNTFQISFCAFVLDALVLLLFGSLMKSLAFEMDFLFIFSCQMVVMFFNVTLTTITLSILLKVCKKHMKYENNIE